MIRKGSKCSKWKREKCSKNREEKKEQNGCERKYLVTLESKTRKEINAEVEKI